MAQKRISNRKRLTKETKIQITIDLDGTGLYNIDTGVVFFDHMLSHISKHGSIDISVNAKGDNIPDAHHLVEDVGIVLGEAVKNALKDKKGINRYGFSSCPMDESMVSVSMDLSGRPFLVFNLPLNKKNIGGFDEELAEEFFRAFSGSSGVTLHIHKICGKNTHHLIESAFKSFGRALKEAVKITGRGIPSTKGSL
jgi:imidazoleglycerol-phosphate dehydratase